MKPIVPGPVHRALLLALLATLVIPHGALAHAKLERVSPSDGERVELGSEVSVTLFFNDALVDAKSSFRIIRPDNQLILEGRVNPDDPTTMIGSFRADIVGDHEIRWTAVADDGHDEVERGTVVFSVVAPPPTPAPTPTPPPAATPTASPSVSPTASPTPSPSPAPSPDPSDVGGTGGDVVIPIVVALVVLGGLAAWLVRRGRPA